MSGPWRNLPPELSHLRAANLHFGQLIRLTDYIFAYRVASGEGDWHVGTLDELSETIHREARPPELYVPRGAPQFDQSVNDFLKDLGI